MAPDARTLTVNDVLDLARPPGVSGFELVHGRPLPLRYMPPDQRRLQKEVVDRLADHVIEQRLTGTIFSDAGFVLGLRREPERMRVADIAYVSRADIRRLQEPERAFRCAPELVVEIALASGRKPGGAQRIIDLVEAGVRVVWVLDPFGHAALMYRTGDGAQNLHEYDVLDAAPVMPNLQVHIADLFAHSLI